MNPPATPPKALSSITKLVLALGAFTVVFILTWRVYAPDVSFTTKSRQAIRMEFARKHIPSIVSACTVLPGVTKLFVNEYTGADGSLYVSAKVPSPAAGEELIATVMRTKPPVTVWFLLNWGEAGEISRSLEPDGTPSR